MKLFVKNKSNKIKARGFSLIEVMVNMVIFGIMMSISFYNYPKLTQALAFNNAAQEIVSTLKSLQISGSSRGGDYSGDGLHMADNPSSYLEFLDATSTLDNLGIFKSNKLFSTTTSPSDFISKTSMIQNNVRVSDLCVKTSASIIKKCGPEGVEKLSITFVRPSITANITDHSETSLGSGIFNFYNKGYIELYQAGQNTTYKKCIVIYNYGQIDVRAGGCEFQE